MELVTRDRAWEILTEYTKSDALLKHAMSVEGVMRHFAVLLGEDPEKWGVVGLLHDIDYEQYPDEHCKMAVNILRSRDIPEDYIHAVVSHGYGICSDTAPEHLMEKVLYAIDELTGLIAAAAIMRPSKSVLDLEPKSVRKKFKTPSFAAKVDREIIKKGALELSMDLDYIIEHTILGMREVSDAIGL